jgi:cytochrome c oxidase subunit II
MRRYSYLSTGRSPPARPSEGAQNGVREMMRNLGLTSIVLAAGLALAGAPAMATQAAGPSATNAAPAAAAAPAGAKAATPATSTAPAPATVDNPLLAVDGAPGSKVVPNQGEPVNGAWWLQSQVTPNGREAHFMHNAILLPLITVICLLVLALLLWVMFRYRAARNPNPSRTSHNTLVEVIWTVAPVLILVVIAVPSIRLLAAQYKPAPDNAVTLKAIGNQWFWSYEYPDHGGISITANMLKEQSQAGKGERYRTDADGPRLLAADNRVVLPVGVPIRLITTANDVIHSWAIPAFWVKLDAVPGRLNETSFTIEKPGLYFGQCSELCGARHAFMPIAVEAVPPAMFARWVAAKGGKMPGAGAPSTKPTPPATAGISPPAAAEDNATGPVENATAETPATNQAATANPAGAGN